MKAILIDPFIKSVAEAEIEPGIGAIYAALSTDTVKVGTFQIINLDVVNRIRNTLYIDENARLHKPHISHGFEFGNYHTPILGRGLILGTTNSGNSRSSTYDLQKVSLAVTFFQ